MNMKIIVNGSQMHYGRGWVSYRPLMTVPGERFQYSNIDDPFGRLGHDADISIPVQNSEEACTMIQSQWPKIFIDPGQSMGGEMQFPFFFGSNWFRIPEADWVAKPSYVNTDNHSELASGNTPGASANATTDKCFGPYGAQKTHMGVVHSTSLGILKHANDATDPVTVQVFLWASDVELSVPTSAPHPEANAMGNFFQPNGRSEYVPNYLGDLAKPSSDIADRLEVGSSSLNTSGDTVGVDDAGSDSISTLAQRESWFDTFTWPVDSPAESLLWQARVTPQIFKRMPPVSPGSSMFSTGVVIPTPMAYAALPFGYWKGSIKYRVQVIGSNLHRGRIRIVYDPKRDLFGRDNVNQYPEDLMNLQYSRTIDIAGDAGRDFTFEVGYMQSKPYLPLLPVSPEYDDPLLDSFNNYGPPIAGQIPNTFVETSSTNGAISIYVLNRLAVPSNIPGLNNDITINVFASAGRDMSFQMPTSRALSSISFQDPTGKPHNYLNEDIPVAVGNLAARRAAFEPKMDSAEMGTTEGENVPTDPPLTATFGDTSQPAASMAAVTFGESMDSWSELMRRWVLCHDEVYCSRDQFTPQIQSVLHMVVEPDFPPFPGPAPMPALWNEWVSDLSGAPYAPMGPNGSFYPGHAIPFAPPSKAMLNGPVSLEPSETDRGKLLRVNPGQLTMLHFVTRLFIGRKGSIKNKYLLKNAFSLSGSSNQIISCKRLSDNGIIDGRGCISGRTYAQDNEESNEVNHYYPASGCLWDQAHCQYGISNGALATFRVAFVRQFQNQSGYTQSGTNVAGAPNWFNRINYPGSTQQIINTSHEWMTNDRILGNTFDGLHVTTSPNQPVMEVEIPFYMNTRFILNDVVLNNTSGTTAHVVKFTEDVPDYPTMVHASPVVERFVAPGTDFALFYLANVPPIYINSNHLYPSVAVYNNGIVEEHLTPYGDLKFFAGSHQEQTAYETPDGVKSFNSAPSRPYFYDLAPQEVGVPQYQIPSDLT